MVFFQSHTGDDWRLVEAIWLVPRGPGGVCVPLRWSAGLRPITPPSGRSRSLPTPAALTNLIWFSTMSWIFIGFHWFSLISIGFHWFRSISIDFHWFYGAVVVERAVRMADREVWEVEGTARHRTRAIEIPSRPVRDAAIVSTSLQASPIPDWKKTTPFI